MGFLAILPILAASQAAAAAQGSQRSPIERSLVERTARMRGEMGVAAKNLATGEEILVNADARFPTASVIKLGVMVEVFHRIAEGKLVRGQLVKVEAADRVGDGGVVDRLHEGVTLSVRDLLDLMIRLSDNSATNVLVRLVGTRNVDDRLASYGLRETLLFRPTFRDGRADVHPELEKAFGLGMSTPREMMRLLEKIARGRVVSRDACDEMISILEGQEDKLMIARGLPLQRGDIKVASKTGWDEEKLADEKGFKGDVRGDVAIVTAPGARYVVAILARRIADKSPTADNEALTTGAAVSRLLYDHFVTRDKPR